MKNRALDHRNDWSTPKLQYDKWAIDYNFSDFDPCPIDGNIKGLDGLAVDWEDRTFVNPPYSLISKCAFIEKALGQQIATCFLMPVSTSTKLFHRVIKPNATHIEFLEGRLKFEGINNKGQWVNSGLGRQPHPAADSELEQVSACGMHDSMLVFFGAW
jgi:DNA N-6-adenine-methyltransferase (Dam)